MQSPWLISQPLAFVNEVTNSPIPKKDAQCSPENRGVPMPPARPDSTTWLKSDIADTWSWHWSKSWCARALAWSEGSLLACVPQYLEEYLRNGSLWSFGRGRDDGFLTCCKFR